MSSSHLVHIAVQHPPFRTLIYKHHHPLPAGVRVQIPLQNLACIGVVVEPALSGATEHQKQKHNFEVRPITHVLDREPIFSKNMLKLADFLSQYYIHPPGDVYRTMLPGAAMNSKAQWRFTYHPKHPEKKPPPRYGHKILAEFFKTRTNLTHLTFKKHLTQLSQKDPRFNSAEQTRFWIREGYLSKSFSAASKEEGKSTEIPSTHKKFGVLKTLTSAQRQAFELISKDLNKGFLRPWLLHGITGSGKTEIYLHLIHQLLQLDTQAQILVMVPEISLTPQITAIFQAIFGDQVTMMHSSLPSTKRWAILQQIRHQKKNILIGPRSSIFAPFARLKLIIVDEEHDSSYKQNTGLHYHGRDVAVFRAQQEGATIILGSATPSLESYHHSTTGKYALASVDKRATGTQLPLSSLELSPAAQKRGQILKSVEDLNQFSSGPSPLAPKLIKALKNNLNRGFQSMVMVQRRGYAHYLLDFKSQKTITCPRCSVSMSVHLEEKKILCHYCGFQKPLKQTLEQHNTTLAAVGFGSEKTCDLLKYHLPQARIQRLDSDLPRLKTQLPEILSKFKKREIDILVGTQMIAKGHDFPAVTLTILLEVDDVLRLPDFRAGERAFQLIVQAAGRSGRGKHSGEVIIQSSRPHHPIITEALAQDYLQFYQREISYRSLFQYPPFTKVILIEFSHKKTQTLDLICEELQNTFLPQLDIPTHLRVLGPTTPPLAMIKEEERRCLMIISSQISKLHDTSRSIHNWLRKRSERIKIRIDVDPLQFL